MADRLDFPFVEKEGKFYAPIVSTEPTYVVENGAVVEGTPKIVSGIKGVYAEIRLQLTGTDAGNKAELFALNTEVIHSS